MDLFASRESTHCPQWFSLADKSWAKVPWLTNARMSSSMHSPPLSLIFPTFLRVQQEGHRLLVAPFWLARIWFPLLHRLCYSPPMHHPTRRDLLFQLGHSDIASQSRSSTALGLTPGEPTEALSGCSHFLAVGVKVGDPARCLVATILMFL